MAALTWYHGGVAGLEVGDELLPPTATGVQCCGDLIANARRDRVYVAPQLAEATVYAGLFNGGSGGDLYEVEPLGEVEVEHEMSSTCERARVVAVLRRGVRGSDVMSLMLAMTPGS